MEETRPQVSADIEHFLFEPEDPDNDLPFFTVTEFNGHEGISQLAHFDIRLVTDEQDIELEKILNKRASLRIWCWQDNDYTRAYHGIISNVRQVGQDDDRVFYQVHMVPLLWRLTLNYQSRIYQEMSVPDVIEEVLGDAGFQPDDYNLSLTGTYQPLVDPPREFCVQYRESDFNFISRLMEEEGIFYFFDYTEYSDKEVLVISDNAEIHPETAPMSEVRYEDPSGLQSPEAEYIHPLRYSVDVIPTNFTLTDFNYDTPQTQLSSPMNLEPDTQVGGFVQSDYPGHFGFPDRGGDLVEIRSQEVETKRRIISGTSNCRSFTAGSKFDLTNHPSDEITDESYLLTRVSHHGVQTGTIATDVQTSYENQFEGVPAPESIPYRPPRVTPRARVKGTQTATVVGPSGEELYMDEKGRAKIQFHWDLEGGSDEYSSCWVRVSHGYAGEKHGIQFHPLIGDEVIVDFLEGDPDKPIIVGRVYNGQNMPPLKPEDRIQNVILTPYQHKLMFDDKATKIKLNTGGNEFIEMTDGDSEKTEWGNNILIKTADDHSFSMGKGTEGNSIILRTEGKHFFVMSDEGQAIATKTTDGHEIFLSDPEKYIQIKSIDGNFIKIDDPSSTITISANGTVAITAGTVTIDATDIKAKASNSISLEAGTDIDIKAGANLTLKAGAELSGEGLVTNLKGSVQIVTEGAENVVQGPVVTIMGGLVKIN